MTTLDNPTAAAQYGLAAWRNFLVPPQAGAAQFILDGRRLRAFNGPGMGAGAIYGNFRYNGGLLSGNATFTQPGDPDAVGMDEDYDACDLENWFLAIQSADGQVMIPSFHRPGIIRYDPKNGVRRLGPHERDLALFLGRLAARILRPVAADGHDASTFPDLVPDPTTGKITYDVDNDGDGVTDSVWLDLGYPARRDSSGQLYKPLFAFMVIGLNGRIPLNTAGNLAAPSRSTPPATWTRGGPTHAGTWATRSARSTRLTASRMRSNQAQRSDLAFTPPVVTGGDRHLHDATPRYDNAGIDVRLTQLRNLLAGTRPQPDPMPSSPASTPAIADPDGTINGDNNSSSVPGPTTGAGNPITCPTASRMPGIRCSASATNPPRSSAPPRRSPGAGARPRRPRPAVLHRGRPVLNLVASPYNNPVRAGYSFDIADLLNGAPAPQPTTTTTRSTPFRSVTPARSATTATSTTPPVL